MENKENDIHDYKQDNTKIVDKTHIIKSQHEVSKSDDTKMRI